MENSKIKNQVAMKENNIVKEKAEKLPFLSIPVGMDRSVEKERRTPHTFRQECIHICNIRVAYLTACVYHGIAFFYRAIIPNGIEVLQIEMECVKILLPTKIINC